VDKKGGSGKPDETQLRGVYAHGYRMGLGLRSLPTRLTAQEAWGPRERAMGAFGGWGHYYDLPIERFLLALFWIFDLADDLEACIASSDARQAVIELLDGFEIPDLDEEGLDECELGAFLGVVSALFGNGNALFQYGTSLNELVALARTGDDEALFKAVRVDPLSLQSRTISGRVAVAHMTNDRAFFDRLSKAITQTKPVRPREEYDDLRLVLTLLEEAQGLDQMSEEEIYRLVVESLELYPADGKDPLAGLRAHIRKHPRKSRK